MFNFLKKKNEYEDVTIAITEIAQFLIDDTGSDMSTPLKEFLDPKKLDFSMESLKIVDSYLDQIRKNRSTLKEDQLVKVVARCGAYCGEVIIKNSKKKRRWIDYDTAIKIDPRVKSVEKSLYTFYILFAEPYDFSFPFAKVGKYLDNGSEDSLYGLANMIILGDSK